MDATLRERRATLVRRHMQAENDLDFETVMRCRPEADRRATLRALASSPDAGARALARLSAPVLGMALDGDPGERSTTGG
jgi:D-tyrosyl-tRNA(Tyr) deacylase